MLSRTLFGSLLGLSLFLFSGSVAQAVGCDPAGLEACQTWAAEQFSAAGCRANQPAFNNAIEDLYLGKGCRIEGIKWFEFTSGAIVKGSVANGKNTDTAGCIGRYTPASHLASGGFFRTPKEALNSQLRNKGLSGCEKAAAASALTAPILGAAESCKCGNTAPAKKPTSGNSGAGGADTTKQPTKPADECSENKEKKNGECVCKAGFEELGDLTCAIVCPVDKHFTRKTKKECGCAQLYRLSEDKKECVFSSEKGFTFDQESRETFQDVVEGLQPNESKFFEGRLANGKTFKIGILRLADGTYVFSRDGQHYASDPATAIKPGAFTRLGDGTDNVLRTIKGWFGIGTYSGEGTGGEEGANEQEDGQRAMNVALLTQKQLEESLKDPAARNEFANEVKETWLKRAQNSATGKWDEHFLEELKNMSGVDVPLIKKILTKDLAGLGEDVVGKLTTFPADSVTTLATELRGSSFTHAVRVYIRDREAKKSPSQLMTNPSTELDYVTSIQGIGQQYAKEALFSAYEEAYQRYLISKQLKP